MQELSTLAKQLQSSKLKLTALKVQVLKDITKITDFKKLNLKLITLQNHIDQSLTLQDLNSCESDRCLILGNIFTVTIGWKKNGGSQDFQFKDTVINFCELQS